MILITSRTRWDLKHLFSMNLILFIYIILAGLTLIIYTVTQSLPERKLTVGHIATGLLAAIVSPFYWSVILVGWCAERLDDSRTIFKW